MEEQSLYQLALCRIRGIGTAYTKRLIDRFGDAKSVFRQDRQSLEGTGLRRGLIHSIMDFRGFSDLQPELDYIRRNDIRMLFYGNPDYPTRLLQLREAPALIFYQGNADLNVARTLGIAGTRKPTQYGTQVVQQIIQELASPDLLIVSGLAFGIDAAAHTAALNCNAPTIGVLGSGLNRVQPKEHWGLARKMLRQGGLISSFPYNTAGATHSFPLRNQLIAGLSDVLVVVESGVPGGSLSTAAAASAFNKICFAVPGRLTDEKSEGCLKLIHEGIARPFLSSAQLCAVMGWEYRAARDQSETMPAAPLPAGHEEELHPRLPLPAAHEDELLTLLRGHDSLSFDDLHALCEFSIPVLSCSLLDLELRGLIRALPGNRYHVIK